jgi:hypothetical protein
MMSNEKSTVMRCVIYVGSLGGRPFQWYVQKVFVVCIFYVSPLRVECFAVCAQDSLFLFVVLAEGAYHIGIGGRPVQWYVRKVFFGCIPPNVCAQDSLFLSIVVAEGTQRVPPLHGDAHQEIKRSFDIDACKQIMASKVVVLLSVETAGDLCQILLLMTHKGFPAGKLKQVHI